MSRDCSSSASRCASSDGGSPFSVPTRRSTRSTAAVADLSPAVVVLIALTPEKLEPLRGPLARLGKDTRLLLGGTGAEEELAAAVGAELMSGDPLEASSGLAAGWPSAARKLRFPADPGGLRAQFTETAHRRGRSRAVRRRIASCMFLGALLLGAALSSASGEATTAAGRSSALFGITPQTTLHRDDLSLMRRTGIGSLRFPIYWSLSEPAPGAFDWRATDAFLISTSGYGFDRLPVIWGSPTWATRAPRAGSCRFSAARCRALQLPVHSRAQRRAWSEFLRALVGRYGPTGVFWERHPELPRDPIRTWQIWNEENDHRFAEASVREYVRLLRGTAPAIRSVDPDARILLGGLYATPTRPPSLDATTFLSRLYRHRGVKGLFDGVALHPYAFDPRGWPLA